jgi:hypothetical protein
MSIENVTWIIENFAKESSYTDLQLAVTKAGHKSIFINGDYKHSYLDGINTECVIFNGSIEMAKLIKQKLDSKSCYPILYCNWEKYLCSKYYSHFGGQLFNDCYAILSLEELKRRAFYYWGQFGKDALLFIRPDSGEKTFQAQLLDIIDLEKFYQQYQDIKHELIVVSTPKNIIGEWRVICSTEKIIDYSLYRYQGQTSKIRAAPANVLEFANKLLKVGYFPDSVFCFDICTDSDNTPWLLELTSFSSAGLYQTNKDNIISEVSKIAYDGYLKNLGLDETM